MQSDETVRNAVYAAVTDLNESLPPDRRIPLAGDANVLAMLDSLAALNLILRIEERIGQATGVECDLANSDLYETTLFSSPSLDDLVTGIIKAVAAEKA